MPDAGATWNLPRLVGLSTAMRMVLLDDSVKADEALAIGLVSRVFPAEGFERLAAATVAALAAGPTLAHARAKARSAAGCRQASAAALDAEAAAQRASGQTKDHLEGVAAFLEKRAPGFQGA